MNKWWNISNIMGDQTQPTFEMTPGFKPFTIIILTNIINHLPMGFTFLIFQQ